MQAPPPTGTTGKAPPGVGRLGAGLGAGSALGKALAAGVSGVGALACAPTATPQPAITTNMAAAPPKAIAVMPLSITISNCMSSM